MRVRRVLQTAAPEKEPPSATCKAPACMVHKKSQPQSGRDQSPVLLHGHREGLCSEHPRPGTPPPPLPPTSLRTECLSCMQSILGQQPQQGMFARRLSRLSTPGRHRGHHHGLGPAITIKTLQAGLTKGQNLSDEQLCLLFCGRPGDRQAPGAVSLCAGLQCRDRVEGGQLGKACRVLEHCVEPQNQKAA